MKANHKSKEKNLKEGLLNVCKLHFALIALFLAQVILYDSSKLITPDVVLQRWFAVASLLTITGVIWYFVKSRSGSIALNKSLLITLILSDVALASFFVYSTRGMASRAVILYVVPIIIAGLLLSRAALFTTAVICIAAYSLTAVSYFVLNFNEGYKVELYGEVGFYSLTFLIIAGLMAAILHSRR